MKVIDTGARSVRKVSAKDTLSYSFYKDKGKLKNDKRYLLLKALSDSARKHSWTSATVSILGRSIVGAGWKFIPKDSNNPDERDLDRINAFFSGSRPEISNISDLVPLPSKIYQTITSYRLFGQSGWHIIRSGDEPIGFDVISGYIRPNVDKRGFFPNSLEVDPEEEFESRDDFLVKPWNGGKPVGYSTDEFVYFFDPGVTGSVGGLGS